MTDNELLLAISDIMDKKIKPIENRLDNIESEIRGIKLTIENDIRPKINLLAENYLPSAKRYENATNTIESMQSDIDTLKKVVREHSEKLQKIS